MKKKYLFITFSFIILIFYSIMHSILFYNVKTNKKLNKLFLIGSSSMQQLCDELGDEFMKQFPDVIVSKIGSGSAQAISAVENGVAQIGDLSRFLDSVEKPNNFKIHIIAKDGIAICTNIKNKINNITKEHLRKVFSGEINNWKLLGGENEKIILIGRDFASGTRKTFEKILNLKTCNYHIELENNGKVKYKIQQDKRAIGYISLSSLDSSVNALKIDGVAPTLKNILNSTYHFSHPLLQITNKNVQDDLTQAWFSFLYSKKGAEIIKRNRFLPVSNG